MYGVKMLRDYRISPTSGSTGLGGISAVVGTNTLPQGKYSGVITITFQNAETPSATIQVQLIVGPAQNLTASVPSLPQIKPERSRSSSATPRSSCCRMRSSP